MNCRESRRLIGGLDGVPPAQVLAAALDHAAACPRCRARAISLADAAMLAAGEELSCAEARRRLPSLVVRPAGGRRGPAPERQALQAHLAACEDCRAEQTLLEAMLGVDPARIQLPEHPWDTSFAAQPPPSPPAPSLRHRLVVRLAALREALQGLGAGRRRDGDQRQPAWALALLTAMLLMVLARVLLRDPEVQRSLERMLPAWSGPRATVDLEALRRAATAAAAGTAGAAATQDDGAARTASPRASGTATGTEPPGTLTPPTPGADASEADERQRATAPASLGPATADPGGPSEATVAPSPASTEAPYPPPDPNDDPPPNPYPDPPTASPVEPPVPTLEP